MVIWHYIVHISLPLWTSVTSFVKQWFCQDGHQELFQFNMLDVRSRHYVGRSFLRTWIPGSYYRPARSELMGHRDLYSPSPWWSWSRVSVRSRVLVFSNGRAALTEYKAIIPTSHSERQQHLCAGRPVPSVVPTQLKALCGFRARCLRPVSRGGGRQLRGWCWWRQRVS